MSKKKNEEDKFIEEWEVTRKKGKLRYIFVNGGISWGLFTGIIYIVLLKVFSLFMEIPGQGTIIMNEFFQLTLFFIFGIIMGLIIWFRNEKRFKQRKPYD